MRVGVGGDGSARVKTRQSGEGKSARRNHEREHTGGRSGATPIRRRRREANDRDRRTRGLNVRQGRRMAPCREDYIARTAREAPKGDRSPTRAYRPVGDTRRSPTGLRALVRGCLHGEALRCPVGWCSALCACLTLSMASPRPTRTTMHPIALTFPFSFLTRFIFVPRDPPARVG